MSNLPVDRIIAEASRVFHRWLADHDADGELDILEAALKYSEWSCENSIAPYLDAAQNSPQETASD